MESDGFIYIRNFEYLYYAKSVNGVTVQRQEHLIEQFPDELRKKVTLLKHFRGYMQEKLSKVKSYFL
jgi:hypothetical protein